MVVPNNSVREVAILLEDIGPEENSRQERGVTNDVDVGSINIFLLRIEHISVFIDDKVILVKIDEHEDRHLQRAVERLFAIKDLVKLLISVSVTMQITTQVFIL